MLESNVGTVEMDAAKPVDREKTCPLLLRVFCSNGRHNNISEYYRGQVPMNELQIYTWMDCTLRELMSLIKEVNPEARRRGTVYDFAVVVANTRTPDYRYRDIGTTCAGSRGLDDNKTLEQLKFEIGDYVDVAITMPGMPQRAPPMDGGGRGGPPRGRGFRGDHRF